MRPAVLATALLLLASSAMLAPAGAQPPPSGILVPPDSSETRPLSPPVIGPAAPPFTANIKLSDDTGNGNQNEVSMTMDTQGRIVAVWNDIRGGNDYRCGRSYSLDGGLTWSANVLYGNPAYDAAGDPVVAADDAGNIYFICMSFNRGGGGSTMEVMRTSDGGVTWSPPVDIGVSGGFNDKPWIAAHGDGYVFVGWTVYSGSPDVVFRMSPDHGQTWSFPQYLGTGNAQYIGIDVDDTGSVHVVFRQGGQMVYRRSDDLGATFTPYVQVFPGGSGCFGCSPRSGTLPALAVSGTGDEIYVVWSAFMGNTTGEDITMASSQDRGASWQAVTVNDDGTNARQFMPFVDVDWEGRVHVMWSDLRSGDHEVYYTNSTDGGSTFMTSIPVTDFSSPTIGFQGDYQALFVDRKGMAHIVWCDTRNGNGDIYYARARVANETFGTIEVTPAWVSITADQTQQFTATGYNTSGSPIPVSPMWETTGGSIDAFGLYTPFQVGNFTVYANDSGVSGTAVVEVTPGALASISVNPPFAAITADETQQFTATGYDAKGNPVLITPTWETTGGSIGAFGLYVPSQSGSFTVYANDSGVSGSAVVQVTPGALASIVVDPPFAAITADGMQQFTATGYDAKGNLVPIAPTWETTGGSVDSSGLYTPTLAGGYAVFANQSGVSGVAAVTVTHGALATIVVDPPFAAITADGMQQFTAAGYDAKGNPVPIAPAWSATNGSVSSAGLFVPWATGSVTIFANQSGVSGSALVNVSAGALATIVVDPPFAAISADQTQQYTAAGYDAKGNPVPITPAWSAENGTIDTGGLLTPWSVGTWLVTATQGSVRGSATVAVSVGVLASIVVSPPAATITADGMQQFTAAGYDAKGNPLPITPTWEATGGSVDGSGLYSPWQVGTFTVYANQTGVSGSATITVTTGALALLTVDPPFASITADETQQFTAAGYDAKGNDVPVSPVWQTTGGLVDSTGLYFPSPTGTFNVYATEAGVTGVAAIEVTLGVLASIVVDPPLAAITADETQQFTAAGYDAKGNLVPIAPAWETTGGAIGNLGLYTPSLAGGFVVFANQSGVSGFAAVTVTPGALASIVVDPPVAAITMDDVQPFTAKGYDANGNQVPIAPSWSATDGSVDASGVYTPTLVGSFTVHATQSGVTGLASVDVSAGALASIIVSPAASSITADGSQQYTAEGFDAYGNDVPISPAWSVENGSISGTGRFSPWAVGTWTVTAAQGGVSGTATVTVTTGAVAVLEVRPSSVTIMVGETANFTVAAWDSKGNPIDGPGIAWSLDEPLGNIYSSGRFEGTVPGMGNVTVSAGGVSAVASLEVLSLPTETAPVDLWPLVVALTVLVAALSFVMVFLLWRRRREEEPEERLPPPPPG